MLGTLVNCAAIIIGSIIGMMLKGGIPEKIEQTVMNGLALCVMLIGFSGIIKVENMLLVICSMIIGGVIGELIDIDKALQKFGDNIEFKFNKKGGKISEGFVSASLLFCVGAMAIVGAMESGLTGNHETLFAKSILDGISAIIFASSLGIGVMLSVISVFIYQGLITIGASYLKVILVTSIINDMSVIGSLLIIAISFNLLGITKIKVANFIPSVFIPIFYQLIILLFKIF